MDAFFFFSSRRRHTRCSRDWSSDVCSSDLILEHDAFFFPLGITYVVYGILRATLLGFIFEEDDDTDIAGPIVIADGAAVGEVFGPPPRGIAPRERERGGQG